MLLAAVDFIVPKTLPIDFIVPQKLEDQFMLTV
jgi:hypothetical protein